MTNDNTVIFLDIDGCLSAGKYARFDLEALQHLETITKNVSAEIVLCTGRSHSYIEALTQIIRLGRYAVTDHGATVFDYIDDQVTLAPQISPKVLEDITVLSQFFAAEKDKHVTKWKICHGKAASLSLAAEEGKDAFAVREVVEQYIDFQRFELLCSGRALDIVPRGVNKWTGAQFFLKMMDKTPDKIVAIGDSQGDLPILTEVDFSACPANAALEVQSVCDYVSPEKEARGVADIFSRFFISKQ